MVTAAEFSAHTWNAGAAAQPRRRGRLFDPGLMTSLGLHAAAAGAALALSMAAGAPSLPPAGPMIEVSVVAAASLPVQRAAVPPAPAEPAPPVPEPVPVVEPTPPEPVPEPPVTVIKGVEELPVVEPKPEPPPKPVKRKAEVKPRSKPQPKPLPKPVPQAQPEPPREVRAEGPRDQKVEDEAAAAAESAARAQLAAAPAAGKMGRSDTAASPGRGDDVILNPSYAEPPRPPLYPDRSIQLSQQGQVVIRAAINARGQPTEVIVWKSSGHELLDRAAVRAVKKWRFVPARRGGAEIAAWVQVPVNFQLKTR